VWLIFGESVPTRDDPSGVIARIFALQDVFSTLGFGIALSFLAYLVGAL
jgi:hypothetical protein